MGITFGLKDLTGLYNKIEGNKLIVNDIPYGNGFTDDELFNNIMTVYDTDVIDTNPRCMCPQGYGLSGRVRLGQICPICTSPVKEVHENIDSNVWLRSIVVDGEAVPFISPEFWCQLGLAIAGSNRNQGVIDYVRWLCDPTYEIPLKLQKTHAKKFEFVNEIKDVVLDGVKSYPLFISRIGEVLQFVINHPTNKKSKGATAKTDTELLYDMFIKNMTEQQGRGIFTNMLPIISKHIFVMENNPKGKYVSLKSAINIGVVRGWLRFCTEIKEREEAGLPGFDKDRVGREICKVLAELAVLNNTYLKDHFYRKPGLIRKHTFGGRVHFSWRSVIVCREGPHDRRDIEMPWSAAVTIFHPHLYSKLVSRGYSSREADLICKRAVKSHDPLIETLLDDVLKDGPGGKIPVIFHRNSSRVPSYSDVG